MTTSKLRKRRPLYGVGINDADYKVNYRVDGVMYRCPFYERWSYMIKRCYSINYQKKQKSYIGCTVTKEWLTFSIFKAWMEEQDWRGMHLDKDILAQGNKIYSPELCLFVTREINILLTEKKVNVGLYPVGVCLSPNGKAFSAKISCYGVRRCLGDFKSPCDAFAAYKSAKYAHIKDISSRQQEPLKSALLAHVIE